MPWHPLYSQHFPRALGSPAALVVLGLDVALGSVLQRARHVALHHVGTVAPRGKDTGPRHPLPQQVAAPRLSNPSPGRSACPAQHCRRGLGGAGAGGTPQPAQLPGRGLCPPCLLGDRDSSGAGGVQGVGTEQRPPVPSLVAGCTGWGATRVQPPSSEEPSSQSRYLSSGLRGGS